MIKRYIPGRIRVVTAAIAGVLRLNGARPIDIATFDSLYDNPGPMPAFPQKVFHLGHSLVGPDIPEMLKQLAGKRHDYTSQLGWGTPLRAHWDPEETINGFELRNAPAEYEDAKQALSSGEYNTLVMTEMVEIRAAIKYFNSAKYLHNWIQLGRQSDPDIRIFFYETWHNLDDKEGWLERIDKDLERYWLNGILRVALGYEETPAPVYVIPAGQVMARFVREVEHRGGVGPIADRNHLFTDTIHLSDYGTYLVALTHYAVLYQTSPLGLPHVLTKADGTPAKDPCPEAARLMQEIVWDVVTNLRLTGLASPDP
ncbi:hypothetical protein K3740_21240 (plasmid) [Ruegeria conchae]|uniref:hypothetical protein n=1 Tax=Ruegeria conchae TaxID=981384 RepID=UPI0021A89F02|nr:hypothetical protein [Ruegeria conchae]UWR05131.1 hypothetical protein K3740_21240 [Ruegeria conchae]